MQSFQDGSSGLDAIDKLSRAPKNQRVFIFCLDSEEEFDRVLAMYRKLRSRFVANLLDSWTEGERFYIVVERGNMCLNEYVDIKRNKIDIDEQKMILCDLITAWLFLHDQKFFWQIEPESVMQFPTGWKVFDLRAVVALDMLAVDPPNPLYCDVDTAAAIIERAYSQFLPDQPQIYRNVGMLLLELFLHSALFDEGVTTEKLYSMVALDDAQMSSAVTDAADVEMLQMLRVILTEEVIETAALDRLLVKVADMLSNWKPSGHHATRSPSSPLVRPAVAGFLPAIM